MILDIIIILSILVITYFGYKGWTRLKLSLHEIYGKFDTIYYMLCDVFKKKHERQNKKNKRRINE